MAGRRLFGFVPIGSWFGRAEGLRTKAFFPSEELGCGGLCPHPLRKLSFLRTFHLLPPLRTKGAANPNTGASHYHNGAAPSLRTTLLQKRTAAVEPPPRRRGLRPLLRVSSWQRALPARVNHCASAIARGLRPPFRLFELHSAIQIRSEVSAPARLWPRDVDAIGGELSSLLIFWFGRAGDTDGGYFLRRTG